MSQLQEAYTVAKRPSYYFFYLIKKQDDQLITTCTDMVLIIKAIVKFAVNKHIQPPSLPHTTHTGEQVIKIPSSAAIIHVTKQNNPLLSHNTNKVVQTLLLLKLNSSL